MQPIWLTRQAATVARKPRKCANPWTWQWLLLKVTRLSGTPSTTGSMNTVRNNCIVQSLLKGVNMLCPKSQIKIIILHKRLRFHLLLDRCSKNFGLHRVDLAALIADNDCYWSIGQPSMNDAGIRSCIIIINYFNGGYNDIDCLDYYHVAICQ